MHVCVCACVHACMRTCVRACVRACVCVHLDYFKFCSMYADAGRSMYVRISSVTYVCSYVCLIMVLFQKHAIYF